MLVGNTTTARSMLIACWHRLAIVATIVLVVEVANDFINLDRTIFSLAAAAFMSTSLSIFLVFRVNEAYVRWWEARTLWGGIVNSSRSFARQIATLTNVENPHDANSETPSPLQRELVYRHLAYINALRMSLRRESQWDTLSQWLDAAELDRLTQGGNIATRIMRAQSQRLMDARRDGVLEMLSHMMIENTLTQLTDLQGGCERIKETAFPDRVAYFTKITAWALAVLIPVSMLDQDNHFDVIDMVVVPLMMMAFLITEKLGYELKDPFENRPNDTAMTAICRTIEIDLRAGLGESDLPAPITPTRGVLL